MFRKSAMLLVIAMTALPLAVTGCKGKVETSPAVSSTEVLDEVSSGENNMMITEPAETVAAEAIPPSAAPEIAARKTATVPQDKVQKNVEIQRALKKAGYYTGAIDGKAGPKTKKAIEDFQKAKGLKADGKVGPKTWAELEKYLVE